MKFILRTKKMTIFTINQIREFYTLDYNQGIEKRDFGQYFTEEYTAVYDNELNFIGYTNEHQD